MNLHAIGPSDLDRLLAYMQRRFSDHVWQVRAGQLVYIHRQRIQTGQTWDLLTEQDTRMYRNAMLRERPR